MLRTALRPRWLALLALALALASGFAWLGSWQLDRARSDGSSQVVGEQPPVPLADVLRPQESLDGPAARALVEVAGTLETDRALVVADRELDGRAGQWLLAPLVVATGDGAGPARLPVVLGWFAARSPVPDPSATEGADVVLTGRLQLSEAPVGLPVDGSALGAVSSADLVQEWGPPVYAAYLLAEQPAPGLTPVPAPRQPAGGGGLALQNLSYAVQWWVFAGFAVFLWWRVVRDAHLDEHLPAALPAVPADPAPTRSPST